MMFLSTLMNTRRPVLVMMTLAVLLAGAVLAPSAWADAYVPDQGMEITAVASGDSPLVMITGQSVKSDDVLFSIWSPTNNLVKVDQVTPHSDGSFETTFNVASLTEDGLYTIVANQGNSDLYELRVQVGVFDGMADDTIATQSNFERGSSMVGVDLFEGGMIVMTADAMEGSDTINISGQTDITNLPVILTVTAPNGNVISVDQFIADDHGLFSVEILIGGSLWSQDGDYTVTASQDMAGYETTVTVAIADGLVIPEFGTIAALVLAAAIVSIVVVSARSRLSLVPRF